MDQYVRPRQHIVAHMGEDQPLRPDILKMRLQRLQAEVIPDIFLESVGLRDEKNRLSGEMKAGVLPPVRTEGIAAADQLHPHLTRPSGKKTKA